MEPIVVNDLMAKEAWAVDQWLEEDHWSKNQHAASIHRERKATTHSMCAHCFRRNCHSMDSTPIHGRKALKKSKIVNGPKRKLSPNFDTSSDDEPATMEFTESVEDPEPADDRVV